MRLNDLVIIFLLVFFVMNVMIESQVVANEENGIISFQVYSGQKRSKSLKKNTDSFPMTKIIYFINRKKVEIQYGGEEIYIKGYENNNQVAFFNEKDYDLINKSIDNVAMEEKYYSPYSELLIKTLSLLTSWPKTLPLFYWKNSQSTPIALKPIKLKILKDQTVTINSKSKVKILCTLNFNDIDHLICPSIESLTITNKSIIYSNIPDRLKNKVKKIQFVPSSISTSLCDKIGQSHSGEYYVMYIDDNGETNYISNDFNNIIGGSNCFGRCGPGCYRTSLLQNSYTQDCFNHDGCVKYNSYIGEGGCDLMFIECIDDFNYAFPCTHGWY